MRLDTTERTALMEAVKEIPGEVFIYGSRVDDQKKGGDIDVLIFSDVDKYRLAQEVSIKFFMRCEEKIDVTVMDPRNLSDDEQAFLSVIRKEKFK